MRIALRVIALLASILLLQSGNVMSQVNESSNFILEGHFESLSDKDSIELHIIGTAAQTDPANIKSYVSTVSDHRFSFKLDINSLTYVKLVCHTSLAGNSNYSYIVRPNDSILISEENHIWKFTGDNIENYKCQQAIFDIFKRSYKNKFPSSQSNQIPEYFRKMDSLAFKCLGIINNEKENLDTNVYQLMKGEIITFFQGGRKVAPYFWNFGREGDSSANDALKAYINPIWNVQLESEFRENGRNLVLSPSVSSFLIDQYVFDSCTTINSPYSFSKCYIHFAKNYSGVLREQILFNLLYEYNSRRNQTNPSYYIQNAIDSGYITKNYHVDRLMKIKTQLLNRTKAFNFSLIDGHNKTVQLSDFEGKVVLLDFWYSQCGPCAEIHPYLEVIRKKFELAPFELIAISIDINRNTWLRSIKEEVRTSRGNINLLTNGKGKNHPVIEKYEITGYPTLVLIDKKGRIISPIIDPRTDNGTSLSKTIKKTLLEE